MAHRDGAQRAADTVASPAGVPSEAGAVDAGATVEAHDDITATAGTATTDAVPAPVPETVPATAAEAAEPGATGRRSRLPRPSSARTPTFGLSLAAIRQRNASSAEGTAELRRSLADKEAQTNELREALDALRRTLDDTTPPNRPADEPPATGGRRRRRGLLLLVAALAVVALAGTFLLTRGGSEVAGPAPAPSSPVASSAPSSAPASSSAPVASSSAPAVTPSTPAPAVATTPMPWRDGPVDEPPGIPTSGPGIDTPGTDVTIAIDRDLAHIDVYERAVFASAQPNLSLALPEAAAWGSTLAGVKPVIDDLQVELDDVAVRPTREGAGWFAIPAAGQRVTRVTLRYRVSGTFVNLAGQSSPVRRLIGVPTFTSRASAESADPVVMRIDDPRVKSLSCLTASSGSGVCQEQAGTVFTATFPSDASPVAVLSADIVPLTR